MFTSLRSILVGAKRSDAPLYLVGALALGGFVVTVTAYALGIFAVSGGVVWVPFHAAIVGICAGFVVGCVRYGLLSAWIVTYMPLLGYRADHAFFSLSGRSVSEQAAYFVGLEALAVLAVEAIALGTIAFTFGSLARIGADALRSNLARSQNNNED